MRVEEDGPTRCITVLVTEGVRFLVLRLGMECVNWHNTMVEKAIFQGDEMALKLACVIEEHNLRE